MLDPPTHNRPFADKRDKVGMDGVPKLTYLGAKNGLLIENEIWAMIDKNCKMWILQ